MLQLQRTTEILPIFELNPQERIATQPVMESNLAEVSPAAAAEPPSLSALEAVELCRSATRQLHAEISKVVVGRTEAVEQILIAILTHSHALFVGVPGLAKTLLISTLAHAPDVAQADPVHARPHVERHHGPRGHLHGCGDRVEGVQVSAGSAVFQPGARGREPVPLPARHSKARRGGYSLSIVVSKDPPREIRPWRGIP